MPAVKQHKPAARRAARTVLLRLLLSTTLSAAAVVVGGPAGVPDTASARELTVRSATTLQVEAVPHGLRPKLRVRLVDNVHQGVAEVPLELVVRGGPRDRVVERRELVTDALGYVRVELELVEGEYGATVSFRGTSALDGSSADVAFEAVRAELELELDAPRLVHVGQDTTFDVSLRAAVPFRIDEAVPVELEVGRGEAAFRHRVELAPMQARAVALVTGRGHELGAVTPLGARNLPRGLQPVRADFEGSALFEPGEAVGEAFFFRAPRMRLVAELVRERDRRGVSLSGSLDSQDGPLPGALIVAEVADGRGGWDTVGELTTEDDGLYAGFVPLDRLPTGEVALRAVFVPDAGAALRSEPVTLDVDAGGATGWISWLLVIFFVVVLGALSLAFALNALRSAWTAWRQRRARVAPVAETELVALEPPPGRTLPALDGIAGQLFDATEATPIASGQVRLVLAGAPRDAEAIATTGVDARGWFALAHLAPGRYWLWGLAHGFVSGHLEVVVPHDGRYRSFRFDLVPVRRRVRDVYLWLLERYSPDEAIWGRLTPREVERRLVGDVDALLEHVGADAVSARLLATARAALAASRPSLRELVDVVTRILEEVYYSDRVFPEEVAELVEQLAERLRDPLMRAGALGGHLGGEPGQRGAPLAAAGGSGAR